MSSRRQALLDPATGYRNPLNASQAKFVENYLVNLNADEAAAAAGYKEAGAGGRLLATPIIAAAIALLHQERSVRTEIYPDEVLRRWWALANADANELEQVRRVNCRYCHGIDNRYQWTPAELERAELKHERDTAKALRNDLDPPPELDTSGGLEFNEWASANPDCLECGGEGVAKAYRCDTRSLSPAAQILYAGAESYPDGTVKKVIMRDPLAALLNVAKHLGMHIERKEISGPAGEPLEIVVKVVRPGPFIEGDVTEAIEAAD